MTSSPPPVLYRFRETAYNLSPRWLRGTWASRFIYAMSICLDAVVDAATLSVRLRFPSWCLDEWDPNYTGAQRTIPTALTAVGRERGIRRGRWESDKTYARRLKRWIDDRKIKGSPYALINQIRCYLATEDALGNLVYPKVAVVGNDGNWCITAADGTQTTTAVNPSNWDWDGNTDLWSRYWVVLWPDATIWQASDAPVYWGDYEHWGDQDPNTSNSDDLYYYGVSFADDLRLIIGEWNPPHARCDTIVIVDPDHADVLIETMAPGLVDGTWGRWHKDDAGTAIESRYEYAAYIDGPRVNDYTPQNEETIPS